MAFSSLAFWGELMSFCKLSVVVPHDFEFKKAKHMNRSISKSLGIILSNWKNVAQSGYRISSAYIYISDHSELLHAK